MCWNNLARFIRYLVHVFWFDLARVTCYMVLSIAYILNLLLRNHWTHGWCMVLMTRLYGDKKAGRETVFSILCCMAQLQSICGWMKNLFLRECKMPWRGYYYTLLRLLKRSDTNIAIYTRINPFNIYKGSMFSNNTVI